MSRPKCCRYVGCMPDKNYFKPRGIPSSQLDEVVLSLDEYEAVRLADFDGLYQEQAAIRMNISRQTFGRIIAEAHRKIADVLINGKALKIAGGDVAIKKITPFTCGKCHRVFAAYHEEQDTKICPHCQMSE
ncbi:MAG: DUF134 domain-containing protein [Smithellaceae bacterium]